MSGVHESHKIFGVLAPESTTTLFCVRCGGARTGATAGLAKSFRDMSLSGADARLRWIRLGMHPYSRYRYPLHVLGPGVAGFLAQEVVEPGQLDMSVRVGDLLRGPSDGDGPGADEVWALSADVDADWAGLLGSPGEDGGAQDGDWLPS